MSTRHYLAVPILMGAILLSGALAPGGSKKKPDKKQSDAALKVKGTLSKNKISMDIKDALVVWNAKMQQLNVYLVPVEIKNKHVQDLRKDNMFFAFSGEPTPDKKKWKEKCPYARLQVILIKDKSGKESIEGYGINIFNLAPSGESFYTGKINDEARSAFKKFDFKWNKDKGTVDLEADATIQHFEDKYRWKLKIKGDVLSPIE